MTVALQRAASLAAMLLVAGCAHTRSATPTRPSPDDFAVFLGAADSTEQSGQTGPRPYDQVILPEAISRRGLFITHRVAEKLYFEIPPRELSTDMLLVGRYARAAAVTPDGRREDDLGDQFAERNFRWERNGHRVLLRALSYVEVADSSLPVHAAVVNANYAPIVAILPVEAYGPDSAPVIEVSRLYITDVPEFVMFRQYAEVRGTLDEKRSYIERVLAFPDNIVVEATQTRTVPPAEGAGADGAAPVARSVVAHWSMLRLPVRLMPRVADERVGYYEIEQIDYGAPGQRAARRRYITRWRLEKKDPTAAVSEPVRPLIYYIDPATPDVWKPWVRKGVLEWQRTFEAAGFKNAIMPMDPPASDPDWSPDDVRHTVIRWLASPGEAARGPSIVDPRTGEILNGSIEMHHNITNQLRSWYFTQAGPLDPRTHTWPMPDSLMGRLLQYVVAHEIGHTLGLKHNLLGGAMYQPDSLRSPSWMRTMGTAPSIMDYARFNYVAQPEDGIALADLVPRVGPYDEFAIRWGYASVPGAHSSLEERATLDRWALVQDTVPWLRYALTNPAGEFLTMDGAVGDADPVWATGWGIKNLQRVMKLIPRVAIRAGEDSGDLKEIYDRTLMQWSLEMSHVVAVVGGATMHLKGGSQAGPVYVPLSRSRQAAAVRFLSDHALATPTYLIEPAIASRLEPNGMLARINAAQAAVLSALLATDRLMRLIDFELGARRLSEAYRLGDLLADVRRGVWTELSSRRVVIDGYRRALQWSYLDEIDLKLHPPAGLTPPSGAHRGTATVSPGLPGDAIASLRGELKTLRGQVDNALGRVSDQTTRTHLQAVISRIDTTLNSRARL